MLSLCFKHNFDINKQLMSGIIDGYHYEIFISYRQKDNKGDRWVSNFVDALKAELEATFKEDVSVYFDENPHDHLQETHNVDKSLEAKLKCLIFMPILSQTYCDPNSYAWQYELLPFLRLVENDSFGKDVKLRGGNVASRILPIRIHDLEPEDIKLFEKETGSVLRSMDFVFKTASGVNRPLKTNEDHPQDNLNKIFYSDQTNKVAHAIKDIIYGMKGEATPVVKGNDQKEESFKEIGFAEGRPEEDKSFKAGSHKWIIITAVVALLTLATMIVYLILFKDTGSGKSKTPHEKSIAVLPFTNLSNDPEQEYFSDGVVEAILNHLFKVGELRVISSTSTKRYKNTELSIKDIARELGVTSILEGSVQKIGNNVRITVQLIDAKTDGHLWSEIYDNNISDIFKIQSEVAQNVARELKMALTKKEVEQIEMNHTVNLEAYNLYLQGRFFWNKRTPEGLQKSIDYFELAISEDPNYALAFAGLADAYHIQTWWGWRESPKGYERAKEYVLKALIIDENLAEAHATLGSLLMWNEWNWKEAQKELDLAVEMNPNCANAHQYYSEFYDIMGERDNARMSINSALKIDPLSPVMNFLSGRYYYYEGRIEESISQLLKVLELNPEYRAVYDLLFDIYVKQGEDQKAIDCLKNLILSDTLITRDTNTVKTVYETRGMKGILSWLNETDPGKKYLSLASRSAVLGEKDKTLIWLEQAVENHESNIPRINSIPDFDYLRSEPGFQALIKKMGLSEFQITLNSQ